MDKKIQRYIDTWKSRGYSVDIPDEVPEKIMQLCLAPSYKAICLAILSNDHSLSSLGFSPKKSEWYSVLKKIEIDKRNEKSIQQKQKRLRSRPGKDQISF
jgi:predicted phosphoadenosine phosphosulfate sulfurtransferase